MNYAGKWNYELQTYELYELPEDCVLYTSDMELKTACAQCGRAILYGDAYTSKEIHAHGGMGYPVCKACNDKEWDRFRKAHFGKEADHENI